MLWVCMVVVSCGLGRRERLRSPVSKCRRQRTLLLSGEGMFVFSIYYGYYVHFWILLRWSIAGWWPTKLDQTNQQPYSTMLGRVNRRSFKHVEQTWNDPPMGSWGTQHTGEDFSVSCSRCTLLLLLLLWGEFCFVVPVFSHLAEAFIHSVR